MKTKRVIIALLCLFLFVSVFAANKDLNKDITMVSYEQRWIDSEGTLALKNNTDEEIHNVVFQITYLDMFGNALDYEDYAMRVYIEPGKTKKLNIPAYERQRDYHYYKSENSATGSPAFKIDFQLKDYNIEEQDANAYAEEGYNGYDYRRESSNMWLYIFLVILLILFVIGISVGAYALVAIMAKNRNRSVVLWVLLSLLATPLLMIIILLCIGKNKYYEEIEID